MPGIPLVPRDTGKRAVGRFVFDHATSPEDEIVFGESMMFALGVRDQEQVRARLWELDLMVDRLCIQTIVVAGDHDNRSPRTPQLMDGEIDDIAAGSVRIKEISGDDEQIDIFLDGQIDDRAECLMNDLAVALRVWICYVSIEVQMDVSGV